MVRNPASSLPIQRKSLLNLTNVCFNSKMTVKTFSYSKLCSPLTTEFYIMLSSTICWFQESKNTAAKKLESSFVPEFEDLKTSPNFSGYKYNPLEKPTAKERCVFFTM